MDNAVGDGAPLALKPRDARVGDDDCVELLALEADAELVQAPGSEVRGPGGRRLLSCRKPSVLSNKAKFN